MFQNDFEGAFIALIWQWLGGRCASGTISDGDKVRKWDHWRWGQGAQMLPQVMGTRRTSGVISDGEKVYHK